MSMTVIGIGTRTGTDDRIGLDLVERAIEHPSMSRLTFELWEGMDPASVAGGLLEIDGPVVLVDAADMEVEPGDYRFFDDRAAMIRFKTGYVSTHGMGLAEGLALARALGFDQPLWIFAVQPFDLSFGMSLTSEMAARVSWLAAALCKELAAQSREWSRDQDMRSKESRGSV